MKKYVGGLMRVEGRTIEGNKNYNQKQREKGTNHKVTRIYTFIVSDIVYPVNLQLRKLCLKKMI